MLEWITLEDAERQGLSLARVSDAIGPRRAGTLYYGGYWQNVNTVLSVHVKVERVRNARTGRYVRKVTHWEVAERDTEESRIRRHCTSWEYDTRNHVLHGPTDTRVTGRN